MASVDDLRMMLEYENQERIRQLEARVAALTAALEQAALRCEQAGANASLMTRSIAVDLRKALDAARAG